MPVIDIFIKTYHGDFIWLEYLLKSIKKFASGFRNVIIVSDNDENIIPDYIVNIIPAKIFYTTLPKTNIPNCTQPIGYVWQQVVKLEWINYTDADAVFILDSDEMLTKPISPKDLIVNDKYTWFYRDWDRAGDAICWKKLTDYYLKIDSKYEAMCITGFVLTRSVTSQFINYVNSLYEVNSIWNTFIKANIEGISEYNAIGNFILMYDQNNEYNKKVNAVREEWGINESIIKSWSWGGLKEEDMINRELILKS
jgi:hypothetical protein